jgi:lysyl-tRNA synthetase, class II
VSTAPAGGRRAAPLGAPLRRRVPTLVAWAVRLVAITSLATLERQPDAARQGRLADVVGDASLVVVIVTNAAVLLVLARALARRKRRAWRFVLGFTLLAVALYARNGAWDAAALNAVAAGLLLWGRRDFTAQSEPSTRWLAARAGLLAAAVAIAGGTAVSARTAPDARAWPLVRETLRGLVGFAPDLPYRGQDLSDVGSLALNGMGVAVVGLVLVLLLQPRRPPAVLAPEDECALRALLEAWGGRDSLGYFALRRDKSVVFSPSGKAAVTYRVVGGVSLASGDPIGDPEAWPRAIGAWLDEAQRFAWVPGVLGASRAGATAYVRAGFDALELGDEAVLDLTSFTLDGRARRPVRQAVSRARRANYRVDVRRQRDLSPDELAEIARRVDELRDGDVERGFSMALGRVGDPADGDVVVVTARTPEGRLAAIMTLVPWGRDGLSLDLMRRSRGSENGTMELLVATLAEHAAALGTRRVSLNFAVFRSALERGSQIGAGPVLRLWRSVLLKASRWWQIESLYRANAKYLPLWAPRHICFLRAADLPAVAVAALQAEAFVVRPQLSRWLRPRR